MEIEFTYILLIISIIVSLLASLFVKLVFKKYDKIGVSSCLLAQDAAEQILNENGIYDVTIRRAAGDLTDNYSPADNTLNLSDSTYGNSSISAVAVAAHECGHAIQKNEGYKPLELRTLSVPMASLGSKAYYPIILLGIILGTEPLINIGILLFSFIVIFQLITLPVEFDASHRALKILSNSNILNNTEMKGARLVLTAAALTYVAAAATSVLQLIRLLALSNRRN